MPCGENNNLITLKKTNFFALNCFKATDQLHLWSTLNHLECVGNHRCHRHRNVDTHSQRIESGRRLREIHRWVASVLRLLVVEVILVRRITGGAVCSLRIRRHNGRRRCRLRYLLLEALKMAKDIRIRQQTRKSTNQSLELFCRIHIRKSSIQSG